jgi:branched-chain amino acid transport system ATP-binding protein
VDDIIRFVDREEDRLQNTGLLNLLGKKKLMIGAAPATKPKILMDLIRRTNGKLGSTIIIIEHFMKMLTELTEELLIIESVVSEKGRIIFNLIETDLQVIMAHSEGQFESN